LTYVKTFFQSSSVEIVQIALEAAFSAVTLLGLLGDIKAFNL